MLPWRQNGSDAPPIRRWLGKGTWTILDQGLFASSNFAVSILLARWLTADAYGAFTVAFALFLLIGTIHSGFLSEPMLVFGPERFRSRLPAYFRTLLRGHGRLALGAGAILGVAAGVSAGVGQTTLAIDLLILAVAQPLLLAGWLMRRACYVELRPRLAAVGSGLYAVITVGGLILLQVYALLSVASAFAIMSVASLAAVILIAVRLRIRLEEAPAEVRRETLERHWRYGRWAAATGALGWVYAWMAFLIVPMFGGLEASAGLRALMNFALPATHLHAAMTALLVPAFVKAIQAGKLKSTAVAATTAVVGGMVAYAFVLGFFGEPLMVLLYGGQYTEHAHLLWLVGVIPIVGALSSMMASILQAMERPQLVFWAHAGGALTAVTFGFGMIYAFGIMGALLFNISADAVNVCIKQVMLKRQAWDAKPLRARSDVPRLETAPAAL